MLLESIAAGFSESHITLHCKSHFIRKQSGALQRNFQTLFKLIIHDFVKATKFSFYLQNDCNFVVHNVENVTCLFPQIIETSY